MQPTRYTALIPNYAHRYPILVRRFEWIINYPAILPSVLRKQRTTVTRHAWQIQYSLHSAFPRHLDQQAGAVFLSDR